MYYLTQPAAVLVIRVRLYASAGQICRVLSQPAGNILLLGEGGTGRETAARTAAILKQATPSIPSLKHYQYMHLTFSAVTVS